MTAPGAKQIQFTYGGTPSYSVNVTLIAMKTTSRALKRDFLAYQQRAGNTTMASVRWGSVSLGGRKGIGGVYRPATEGGTSIADGIYVIPWHSTVYIVNIIAMQSPAPTTLSRFPGVYRQMLASWHFK
jgi:hypothetical protein